PHAPVAVACLGFRSAAGLGVDVDAYGFVAARGECTRGLGCQYETSVFSDRAPAGGVLLRALLGGTFDPGLVDADDATIAAQAIARPGRRAVGGEVDRGPRRRGEPHARARLHRRLARAPRNSAIRSVPRRSRARRR